MPKCPSCKEPLPPPVICPSCGMPHPTGESLMEKVGDMVYLAFIMPRALWEDWRHGQKNGQREPWHDDDDE